MKTIHKYQVVDGVTRIPMGARIIPNYTQAKYGRMLPTIAELYIYAEVDTEVTKTEEYEVLLFGTGWELPNDIKRWTHLHSFDHQSVVWHVYIRKVVPAFVGVPCTGEQLVAAGYAEA